MRTSLVIGGTGGIGQEVVRRLVCDGHAVTFTYLKAADSARAVCESLRDAPGSVACRQLDVRSPEHLAETVAEVGTDGLDTVVFAAASTVSGPLRGAKRRHWDFAFQANARAFGLLFQSSVERLAARQGSLVTISSVGGRLALPDYALIGAMKAAIEALVLYAAVEAGPLGVRVNSVCPGIVETKALQAFDHTDAMIQEAVNAVPAGRFTTPAEVAAVIAWLTGPESRMITGQNIVVDGGWELAGLLPRTSAR